MQSVQRLIHKSKMSFQNARNNEACCYRARQTAQDDEARSLLEGNKCCQKNKRMLLCRAKDEKDRHPGFFLRGRTERTECGGAINPLGRCRVRRSGKRLLLQPAERA